MFDDKVELECFNFVIYLQLQSHQTVNSGIKDKYKLC